MDNKKSLCYMSLADAFLTRLRKDAMNRTRSRIMKGVGVEVLPVTIDRQDFIYEYLTKLYDQKKGTFSKPKIFARQTIYECERSNACKGNSSGDPTKTRANGCTAYVSFMFEEGATITACIIRYRLLHSGHDPTNREESKVSRIDQSLKTLVEVHIKNNMKISDIMNEIVKWNKVHKNTDHKNRRFFPSRQDIQQLALSMKKPFRVPLSNTAEFKKPRKYDTPNKDNVTRMLRTEFRETCVYYQSKTTTGGNPRPLIVVLQNADQKDMFNLHGQHLVFIEKNYEGLRQYGNAVYVLVVKTPHGNVFPVAYIITSADDGMTFAHALQKLRAQCPVTPKVFFVDHEMQSYTDMIAAVYPESLVYISWYQVAQEVHKWLQSSLVSEKEHADVRKVLIQFMSELRGTVTEEEFILVVSVMDQRIEFEAFTSMLQADWLPCASKWCDFGRNCLYNVDTNLVNEKYFMKIQQQFLKGLHTRKSLEDLLKLINLNVMEHRNFVDGMVNMSVLMEGTASEQAGVLLQQGWAQLITWQGQWLAHVPCHNIPETTYRINLVTMECECPTLTYLGPCLHLCLVLMLTHSRDGLTPEQERHRVASEAFENSDFIMDNVSCTTFHSGSICVIDLKTKNCTCLASSFDVECVGKTLLNIADGTEEAVTYTIPKLEFDPISGSTVENSSHTPLTITVSSQSVGINSAMHTLTTEKPIVIQTCTGIPNKSISLPDPSCSKQEITIKEEYISDREPTNSTKGMIEKLYRWSTSPDFTDSKALKTMLKDLSTYIFKEQHPIPTKREEVILNVSLSKKPIASSSNKKLRAVVRTVKRRRSTDDEDDDLMLAAVPSVKVSRSGRQIKVKEEPDFVT